MLCPPVRILMLWTVKPLWMKCVAYTPPSNAVQVALWKFASNLSKLTHVFLAVLRLQNETQSGRWRLSNECALVDQYHVYIFNISQALSLNSESTVDKAPITDFSSGVGYHSSPRNRPLWLQWGLEWTILSSPERRHLTDINISQTSNKCQIGSNFEIGSLLQKQEPQKIIVIHPQFHRRPQNVIN